MIIIIERPQRDKKIMPSHKDHQEKPKPLAVSPYCELWKCEGCEMVHFIMGDISLRLNWTHIVGIANTLNLAVYERDVTASHSETKSFAKRTIN